jgi:hypothetical protein
MTTTTSIRPKTTCGQHRTLGYAFGHSGGVPVMLCRGCGESEARHETTDETVARKRAESGTR